LKDVEGGKSPAARVGELKKVASAYFEDLKADIKGRIGSKSVDQYIKDTFKENMLSVAKANQGKAICHSIGTINCVEF
jgi:hypothetical protein